jgi:hypothetical protein
MIDDVRLYDVPITAAQVQALFTSITFDGTDQNDRYFLKRNGSNLQVWVGSNGVGAPSYSVAYTSVASLIFEGAGGDDSLTIDTSAGNPIPTSGISFDAGAGIDTAAINGSSAADTFTFNPNTVVASTALIHTSLERRTLAGNGGTDKLTINAGSVALAGSLTTDTLALATSATLDLKNFALVRQYTGTSSPLAALNALIASARNGGAWNGTGIISSNASGTLTTVGLAEASDALNLGGSQTALWNGQTVDATAVLMKWTYAGDTDLDGTIDGDDFARIDAGYSAGGNDYAEGDFDYNGRVDADDYFIIDANYNKAQQPLAPALALSGAEVFSSQNIFAIGTRAPDRRDLDLLQSGAISGLL